MKSTEILKATPNYSARTFTIRKYIEGKLFAKYRTSKLSAKEFDSCEMQTQNDWKYFLRTNEYHTVKIYYNNF